MNQLSNREILNGKVIKEQYAFGSKSERDAHMLVVGKEKLLLRRAGQNAFSDDGLDPLVGKKVSAYGYRHLGCFVMESYSLVKPKGKLDRALSNILTSKRSIELTEKLESGKRVCRAIVYDVKEYAFINPHDLGTSELPTKVKKELVETYVGSNWDTVFANMNGKTIPPSPQSS